MDRTKASERVTRPSVIVPIPPVAKGKAHYTMTRRDILTLLATAGALPAAERRKMKILVLCTGNSCRSQMTEGFLKSFDSRLEVYSAGTSPSSRVNPFAIRVMQEVGIDISDGRPKKVDTFLDEPFDYVITVCDDADKNCPYFRGKVGKRLHIGFPDPATATGTEEEILTVFRQSRDDIAAKFRKLYDGELKPQL
jgi:arsenate reductase